MADKHKSKDFINYVLVIALFVLAAFVIYPVLYSIIYGIIFAFILYPIYKWVLKKVKNEFLAAIFVCIGVLIIIAGVVALLFGIVFNQIVQFYLNLQKVDLVDLMRRIMPEFLSSSGFSENIISSINTQVTSLVGNYLKSFTNLVSQIPKLIVQIGVAILTFFFALKDGKKAIDYLRSFSPLKKDTEEKFLKQFRDITNSVLIGHIVVGIVQGLVAGIGFFIFGVHNAVLLTFLTALAAIIPIFGAWLIWVPVDIYLFASGKTGAAIGLLLYGLLIVSWIDNLLRILIVSRKTKINTGIIFIGMLGGLLAFGFLGLLIGPLILAYILLIIEVYRKNTTGENSVSKKPD
jgi:predicted PurR-regulated permease PerM